MLRKQPKGDNKACVGFYTNSQRTVQAFRGVLWLRVHSSTWFLLPCKVGWVTSVGLKRRGDPSSLYLTQRDLNKCVSKRKANGGCCPPAYTRAEYLQLAQQKITSGALQHSDGATAYKVDLPGVKRDVVVHSYAKGGPEFVKKSPVQGSFAGTQSLDGWWGWAKKATFGVKASNENSIACHVHEWDAAAEMIRFHLN